MGRTTLGEVKLAPDQSLFYETVIDPITGEEVQYVKIPIKAAPTAPLEEVSSTVLATDPDVEFVDLVPMMREYMPDEPIGPIHTIGERLDLRHPMLKYNLIRSR
jgi:hypothetical protein